MTKTQKKRLRLGAFAALLLAAAAGFGFGFRPGADAPQWETIPVSRGDVENTVTCLGSLQPKDYVDVGAQVSGQLKQVLVDIGDHVEKGQLLAVIDDSTYRAQVEGDKAELANLNAQVAQEQAELELAQLQYKRNAKLREADAVSQSDLDTSRSELRVAEAKINALKAQIRKAESSLSSAQTNLEYTRIYAPMSGTVIDQTALEGETLNANQSAPEILRIADVQTMTVEAEVTEADVVKIRPGMTAWFTTLGLPDRRWQGTVRQVKPTPETENDVVLYYVLIDVPNDDGVLMTEMTAQVFFVISEARNALTAPVSALRQQDGKTYLPLLRDGKVRLSEVQVGVEGRTEAEIVSGAQEGDLIVTGQNAEADAAQPKEQGPPGMMGPKI
ncbi:macrolide transporter subunit MacA [Paucidesulfovibrio longus]|uniref:macrolide transporter subunit MacA n=1 Tax=Paucidesulfovibrio longus TaxID=889 RepID=UPI0003B507A5|nr:macrolide transporter subunit MacA [Paucidesulfovibrio longus]